MRPAVNVTTRDNAPPSTIPTDVGTGFMVGVTEFGKLAPTEADLVQNMDEFTLNYAPSGRTFTAGITMLDSAEEFFAQGGNRLYVGRVAGPAAVAATVALKDGAAATVLNATARSLGTFGNKIQVNIITNAQDTNVPAGSFRIELKNTNDGSLLDASPILDDVTAAIAWSSGTLIVMTGGASVLDPVAGAFSLAGGADDTAGVTNVQWQRAYDGLSLSLGPGILFAPGVTTAALYNMAVEAALDGLRVALLDGADTATAATLVSSVKAVVDSTLKRSRFGGMFAPWLYVPGLTTGTVRKIPPSPAVAGKFAANMAAGYSANAPAAGELGRLETVLDFTQSYSDSDRQYLNDNGVNVIKSVFGVSKVYGWRSTADPVKDPRWINLGNSILHRQIVAEAGAVGERFMFREIDGQGHLLSEFGSALIGEVCMPLYLSGSLYGATPQEAFKVDVGPSVNTDATIANNEVHAVISVRMAPFGEEIDIAIVKYLVTEAIPV